MKERAAAGRRREGAETGAAVTRTASRPPTAVSSVLSLHGRIGNRAVERLFVQRLFDESDFKRTGKQIWDRYTPNKDAGTALTSDLATKCGGSIDTGRLAAVAGPQGAIYKKIGTFLTEVLTNMAANSFPGSTVIHGNDEGNYPADPREERYAEFGVKGLEQTRIVYDRAGQGCWISTHYESPKVLLLAGAPPAAAMKYMEDWLQDVYKTTPLRALADDEQPAAAPAVAAAAPAAAAPAQAAAGRGRARNQNQAAPKGGGGAKPAGKQGKKKK